MSRKTDLSALKKIKKSRRRSIAAGSWIMAFTDSIKRMFFSAVSKLVHYYKQSTKTAKLAVISATVLVLCGAVVCISLLSSSVNADVSAIQTGALIAAAELPDDLLNIFDGISPVQSDNTHDIEATVSPAIPTITSTPSPSYSPSPYSSKPSETIKPTQTTKPSATPTPKPSPTAAAPDLNKLTEYYMVEADKYYNEYNYSSNSYDYTEDEVMMLARVITREAGGEKDEGQIAVGNVVMNRVFTGHWGNTIESVVTAPKQFAYKADTVPKQRCIDNARKVLKNEKWVVAQNVYYFNSGKKAGEDWGSHKYYDKIGNHCFYTDTIGKRRIGSGVPSALFERVYKWPQYGCKPAKRVSRIQHMLIALGYKVQQDGYFGKSTKDALVEFQKSKRITADGVAGPTTLKALIKAYGVDKYVKDYGS